MILSAFSKYYITFLRFLCFDYCYSLLTRSLTSSKVFDTNKNIFSVSGCCVIRKRKRKSAIRSCTRTVSSTSLHPLSVSRNLVCHHAPINKVLEMECFEHNSVKLFHCNTRYWAVIAFVLACTHSKEVGPLFEGHC